jgi:protein TonB
LFLAFGLQTPLNKNEEFIKKVNKPPVIIELENIPETTQRVTAPAPRFAMPLEVSDDVMLDDVTIEDTSLDVNTAEPVEIKPVIMQEEVLIEEEPIEEIFEFFAVEEQPQRISEVAPVYPRAAQEARVQGTVFVRALVGTDGSIETAEVLKGPDLLHEAAINAALATKFTPAKQNDMPVKCWVQMRFNFELEG